MSLDQIEDLIRRYLAAGVAVVVILAGPVTGAAEESGSSAGRPAAIGEEAGEEAGEIEIRDGTPGADASDEDASDEDPSDEDASDEDASDEDASDEDASDEDASDEDPSDEDPSDEDPVDEGAAAGDVADGDAADEGAATDRTTEAPAASAPPAGGEPPAATTAAERYAWGLPDRNEDFRTADLAGWEPYTGPGYQGRGERSPDQLAVGDGVLTISGDARGTTGGMCWGRGQRHGRWEARLRAPAADPAYHAVLLLWPDADDFPAGGQVDVVELTDPARRSAEFYLHSGEDDDQVRSEVQVDATRWHAWAVEWTPDGITGYLDGEPWFSSTDRETLPPGPMHLCVQLDFFPTGNEGDGSVEAAEVRPSRMDVDWVRQYSP